MSSLLVRLPLDRAVLAPALAGNIVFGSWARHFTFAVPLSTQVYRWVPAHSGQTQKSNATSGFRCLELRKSLKKKTCKTSVGKCYKNSTVRENYKLGGL